MNVRAWVTGKLMKALDLSALSQYLAYGSEASGGIVVSPTTAMQAATVYSCVKVLAEDIAKLPIQLYTGDSNTSQRKTYVDGDGLAELLRYQPSEWQTATEFWEMMVAHLNLRGNAYAYVNRVKSWGRVVELIPLHPDFVTVEQVGNAFRYRGQTADGGMRDFQPGELLHIRGLVLNGWLGISPISYARESIGLALSAEQFGARLFRNGAKMGGVLEHPGKMSKESYERVKSTFDAATSGENAHKTALLEEGLKFSKITMTPDDAQFLDTRKHQRSEICGIFRVPPHKVGDLERATFTNIEQQSQDFVVDGLLPWTNRIELALRRCVFTPEQRKAGMFGSFDFTELLRGDSAARAAYYASGIEHRWLTPNEARYMEDLNPLPGGDRVSMPMNMVVADDQGNFPVPPKAVPAPQPKASVTQLHEVTG